MDGVLVERLHLRGSEGHQTAEAVILLDKVDVGDDRVEARDDVRLVSGVGEGEADAALAELSKAIDDTSRNANKRVRRKDKMVLADEV